MALISFMLNNKNLAYFTALFLPNNFKKNNKKYLKMFNLYDIVQKGKL